MARRIDERNLPAIFFDAVSANVLSDAATFATDNIDVDDAIQE